MLRSTFLALLAGPCLANAQVALPADASFDLPDFIVSQCIPFVGGPSVTPRPMPRPTICVLPPPIEFKPFVIEPTVIVDPIQPIIAGPCLPFIDPELLNYVLGESADRDVSLGFNYMTGLTQLTRRSTGAVEVLSAIPASLLVAPDAIAPAVMVELNATALSADGNVVIGAAAWSERRPFRHRAWGTGGLELLQVPADTYRDATAVDLSANGDVVIGSAYHIATEAEHAVRWNKDNSLIALNPNQPGTLGSKARLMTPDGSVIAGDVYNRNGPGLVPFIWNQQQGFRQLGDPLANDRQVIVDTLSKDGLVLTGQRYETNGDHASWYWTEAEGFKDLEIVITGLQGEENVAYTLTGIDPQRGIFVGTFADGTQFMNFRGVSISPVAWMRSVADPVEIQRAAFGVSGQAMEGAHHRPISSLALPGKASFAWFTGDFGKAWKDTDTSQTSGEIGYGVRLGLDAVLGVSFGYSDLHRTYGTTGDGKSRGGFAVADLGFATGKGETTLTAFFGHTSISTSRAGSLGESTGNAFSLRARYDAPALDSIKQAVVRPYASVTFDHANMGGYAETGGVAPASFDERNQRSWVGRLGVSAKFALSADTDLLASAEFARVLSEDRPDFTGTDVGTGVLDFAVPDVRLRNNWGRLGLDLDHRLSPDTVLSLTTHASTRGDAFDLSAAISLRKGF